MPQGRQNGMTGREKKELVPVNTSWSGSGVYYAHMSTLHMDVAATYRYSTPILEH